MSVPIVKICGLKSLEAAECAVESGADLLGVILVPNRSRTVDDETLLEISKLTHAKQKIDSKELLKQLQSLQLSGDEYFKKLRDLVLENGPYLVGVFRNQPLEEVKALSSRLNLDFVQLHGSENFQEYIDELDIPVISRYVLNTTRISEATVPGNHFFTLLDSELGGEGKLIDWNDAAEFAKKHQGEYLLAGGLTPENVGNAIKTEGCLGVDVAGGVETNGVKDLAKIKQFVHNAKRGDL